MSVKAGMGLIASAFCFTLFFTAHGEPQLSEKKAQKIEAYLVKWSKEVGRPDVSRVLTNNTWERRRLLRGLNRVLRSQGLETIQMQGDMKIEKSCLVGFVPDGNCFSGLRIESAGRRFCLPCIVTFNQVIWSIDKAESPVVSEGPPKL